MKKTFDRLIRDTRNNGITIIKVEVPLEFIENKAFEYLLEQGQRFILFSSERAEELNNSLVDLIEDFMKVKEEVEVGYITLDMNETKVYYLLPYEQGFHEFDIDVTLTNEEIKQAFADGVKQSMIDRIQSLSNFNDFESLVKHD